MLKKVLSLLFSKLGIGLGGVALFSALVWFGGDWLGWTVTTRIVILAIGAILVSGFVALQQILVARNATAMEERLRGQGEEQKRTALPSEQEEIEALEGQFAEALTALKQSKMGRSALYAFPWYVIIGPPGSGKSTLINECKSLNMPYSKHGRGEVRGVGGTRNCDWFFTDQAILLDTAGRYMTEMEDREEWLAFLQMLEQGRKHQPINGVLVAISIPEIVAASEDELNKHAENIRNRLDELTKNLNVIVPVYLIFTKCDLLDGFVEFFGSYERKDREQVWGCTVDPDPKNERRFADAFDEGFKELYRRLDSERVVQLSVDRSRRRKQQTYSFPLQLALARKRLGQLVDAIAQPNPYQESAFFRGFYFSSGTQEGEPMNHVIGTIGAALGVSPPGAGESGPVDPQAYFIDDLFTKVIFPDQQIARRTEKIEKRRHWVRYLVTRGSVAAVALVLIGMTVSFFTNLSLVKHTREIIDEFKTARAGGDIGEAGQRLIAQFGVLSEHILTLDASQSGLSNGWGLDLANDMQELCIEHYRPALVEHFLRSTIDSLKAKIRKTLDEWEHRLDEDPKFRPTQADQEAIQAAFRVYWNLTHKGEPNPSEFRVVLDRDVWTFGKGGVAAASATGHAAQKKFFVESVVQGKLFGGWRSESADADVILAQKRFQGAVAETLGRVNDDHRIVGDILAQEDIGRAHTTFSAVLGEDLAKEFQWSGEAEPQLRSVFVKGTDEHGRFERKVAEEASRAESGGDESTLTTRIEKRKGDIFAVFHRKSGEAWEAFIDDIRPPPFRTLREAKQRLPKYTRRDGSVFKRLHERIVEKWPGMKTTAVTGDEIERGLLALDELSKALEQISDDTISFTNFDANKYGGFKAAFQTSREKLKELGYAVVTPLEKIWAECDRTIRKIIADAVNSEWVNGARTKVNLKAYPFANADAELSVVELQVFRKDGELQGFFNKLDAVLRELSAIHRPYPADAGSDAAREPSFQEFKAWVERIRSIFFADGDDVVVKGKIVFADPTGDIQDFEAGFGSQKFTYQQSTNDPTWSFDWKLEGSGKTELRIQVGTAGVDANPQWHSYLAHSDPGGSTVAPGTAVKGEWGFLRLLQAGIQEVRKDGITCKWTFKTPDGRTREINGTVTFAGTNPFYEDVLTKWSNLPQGIYAERSAR